VKISSRNRNGGRTVAWSELQQRKKSDTLVILGSGRSINEIGESHWREFSEYDTIGFNFWPIHKFVPSFYFFETPRDKGRYEAFKKLFVSIEDQYKSSLVIYKDVRFAGDSTFKDRVFTTGSFMDFFSIPGSTSKYFNLSLSVIDFFYRRGLFNAVNFWKRASIIGLLFLGIKMKYRRIIICGIDLMNSDYFYDTEFAKNQAVSEDVISFLIKENSKVFSSGSIHKTNNKLYGELIVEDLIRLISEHKISRDISILVYNNSSLLSKYLPTYN
jgi:hypothetical protein